MAKIILETAIKIKNDYINMKQEDKNIINWWLGSIILQKLKGDIRRDWYGLVSLGWIILCRDGITDESRDHINGRTFVGQTIMEKVTEGCSISDIRDIIVKAQKFVILEKKSKDGTSPNFKRSNKQDSLDKLPYDTFKDIGITLVKLDHKQRCACSRGDKEEINKILQSINSNPSMIYSDKDD